MNRDFLRPSLGSALLMALLLVAAPAPATGQDFDLTGEWILNVESPNGMGQRHVTFVQKDGKLTGTISSSMASGDLNGTIEGNKVTFVASILMDAGAFDVSYTAIYEDGELKNGEVDFGDYGGGGFTGHRKPAGG